MRKIAFRMLYSYQAFRGVLWCEQLGFTLRLRCVSAHRVMLTWQRCRTHLILNDHVIF